MSLISPNFEVKSIIFSQFWPGSFFPKLLGKALWSRKTVCIIVLCCVVFQKIVMDWDKDDDNMVDRDEFVNDLTKESRE